MNNFQWMQKLRSIISVKKKRAGFMLADVIITGTLLAGLAVGFAGLFSSSFVSLGNMRTGLQTQAIAQAKSSQIIAQGYSSMADEPRAAVTGTNFEREVVLGTPVDLGSGAFQRTATINVYKPSESTPRMSLDVPLSSQGSNADEVNFNDPGYIKFSNGFIMQWGNTTVLGAGSSEIIFYPKPFPHACLNIQATASKLVGTTYTPNITDKNNAYFSILNSNSFGANTSCTNRYYWIAIGY